MDLQKIIAELKKERVALEDAIVHLEQFARTQPKRRGRPPAYLSGRKPRKRKPFSEATKRKMAAAQKRRWASSKASGR
jgi:hypothetical protein